jgi:hypothetical protein
VKSTTSPAERRIYQLLQQKLDDNYYVIHGKPWSTPDEDGRIINGEIDFIIAHAEYGILLFEVKGGDIHYDGTTNQWKSINHYKEVKNIHDPFMQASTCAHKLKKYLKNAVPSKSFIADYWVAYAVWFPDVPWQPGAVTQPHVVNDLVLDMRACDDPEQAIRTIMMRNKKRRTMAPNALEALIHVLAGSFMIKAKLHDKLDHEGKEFIQLRKDQYRKLELLGEYSRIGIRGAAGTGKTVIALEAARRLAKHGLEVLFLCSTPALARWLISMVNEEPEAICSRITARNVEHLCMELSGQAGILLDEQTSDEREELGSSSTQKQLANKFRDSVTLLEKIGTLQTYDAILVDEGQDIEQPLWTQLPRLLRDNRNGKIIGFYDPAQSTSDGQGQLRIPGNPETLWLNENCRNTQHIFQLARQFYLGPQTTMCVGPTGEDVAWIDPGTSVTDTIPLEERDVTALEQVLDNLVENEHVSPGEILVIVGRTQDASLIYKRRFLGQHILNNNTGIRDPKVVRVTTVRSSKGLESPVVILAELSGIQSIRESRPKLYCRYMYIATSRAMNRLIVLSTPEKTLPLQPVPPEATSNPLS